MSSIFADIITQEATRKLLPLMGFVSVIILGIIALLGVAAIQWRALKEYQKQG